MADSEIGSCLGVAESLITVEGKTLLLLVVIKGALSLFLSLIGSLTAVLRRFKLILVGPIPFWRQLCCKGLAFNKDSKIVYALSIIEVKQLKLSCLIVDRNQLTRSCFCHLFPIKVRLFIKKVLSCCYCRFFNFYLLIIDLNTL